MPSESANCQSARWEESRTPRAEGRLGSPRLGSGARTAREARQPPAMAAAHRRSGATGGSGPQGASRRGRGERLGPERVSSAPGRGGRSRRTARRGPAQFGCTVKAGSRTPLRLSPRLPRTHRTVNPPPLSDFRVPPQTALEPWLVDWLAALSAQARERAARQKVEQAVNLSAPGWRPSSSRSFPRGRPRRPSPARRAKCWRIQVANRGGSDPASRPSLDSRRPRLSFSLPANFLRTPQAKMQTHTAREIYRRLAPRVGFPMKGTATTRSPRSIASHLLAPGLNYLAHQQRPKRDLSRRGRATRRSK